jgi:hypothetical protein
VTAADAVVKNAFTEKPLSFFVSTANSAKAAVQAVGDGPVGSTFKSVSDGLKQILNIGEDAKNALTNMVHGATSVVTTGLGAFTSGIAYVRDIMQGIGWAASLLQLSSSTLAQLRLMRTELRNLLCGFQSVLSFPHYFIKGARDILQGVFNLFQLSGCATSFPSIKAPSWQPEISLALPGVP